MTRLEVGDAREGGLLGRLAAPRETVLELAEPRPWRMATTTSATTPKRARMAAEGTTRSSHAIGAGPYQVARVARVPVNQPPVQVPGVTR